MTLTCDLISRIIVSVAYLLHYLRKESKILCVDASWDDRVSSAILGSLLTLTSDLVSRIIVSVAYLLHFLSLESQIQCVFASWIVPHNALYQTCTSCSARLNKRTSRALDKDYL